MARLTDDGRLKICELYKKRRKELADQGTEESEWRTLKYINGHVGANLPVIRETLIAKGLIDPRPPVDIDAVEMKDIVNYYNSGMSLHACEEKYGWAFNTIRKVLIFNGVKLRGPGGPRERRDRS